MPIPRHMDDGERIYRSVHYGPSLDIFFLDMRSYRGPNSTNRQATQGPATVFLGDSQIRWLKLALMASKATGR